MTESVIIPSSLLIVLLALILYIFNRKQNSNVLFISLFLIIFSIQMVANSVGNFGGPMWLYAVLLINFSPVYYLIPVLLYFFVRSTFSQTPLRTRDLLHLIPFLIAFVSILPYLFTSYDYKLAVADKVMGNYYAYADFDFGLLYPQYINQLVRTVLLLLYLAASIRIISRFRSQTLSATDTLAARNRLISKPIVIVIVFFAIYGVFSLLLYFQLLLKVDLNIARMQAKLLLYYSNVVYLSIPVYLLFNPAILYSRKGVQAVENDLKTIRRQVNKSTESCPTEDVRPVVIDDIYTKLADRIMELLRTKKPYLNPAFTVHDLCTDLNAPRHHVQYCLKNILNTSFTDLKNGFRIEHAKQLLSEKKDPRFTIDGVGLQAGFASSSNFYATFKEVTGMTPNQWIEAPSNSSPDIIGINSGGA